jgi:RimJ/RimL family protein N-acetyltransferase
MMNFPFDEDILLENAVARLRPIRETDKDNLLALATQDKNLLQFSPAPVYTEDLLQTYIDNAVNNRRIRNRYTFIVFDKRHNAYAGSTSFLNISNTDDRLEIGAT